MVQRIGLLAIAVMALALLPAAALQAQEKTLWWAVAISSNGMAYGAVWDVPNIDDSKRMAIESCEEKSNGAPCRIDYGGSTKPDHSPCFAVIAVDVFVESWGRRVITYKLVHGETTAMVDDFVQRTGQDFSEHVKAWAVEVKECVGEQP